MKKVHNGAISKDIKPLFEGHNIVALCNILLCPILLDFYFLCIILKYGEPCI